MQVQHSHKDELDTITITLTVTEAEHLFSFTNPNTSRAYITSATDSLAIRLSAHLKDALKAIRLGDNK